MYRNNICCFTDENANISFANSQYQGQKTSSKVYQNKYKTNYTRSTSTLLISKDYTAKTICAVPSAGAEHALIINKPLPDEEPSHGDLQTEPRTLSVWVFDAILS